MGRTVYIVGAEYPDMTRPQVWIDKETFRPIRQIIMDQGNEAGKSRSGVDVRYLEWTESGNIPYPMRIEFHQDGALVRAITVRDMEIDPSFPPDLFNIRSLISMHDKPFPEVREEHPHDEMEEVRRIIEEFRELYNGKQ